MQAEPTAGSNPPFAKKENQHTTHHQHTTNITPPSHHHQHTTQHNTVTTLSHHHQVLSEIVKEANCGTAATMRMDDNITAFEDCLGGCERILKTPIPLSYTRCVRCAVLCCAVLCLGLQSGLDWDP